MDQHRVDLGLAASEQRQQVSGAPAQISVIELERVEQRRQQTQRRTVAGEQHEGSAEARVRAPLAQQSQQPGAQLRVRGQAREHLVAGATLRIALERSESLQQRPGRGLAHPALAETLAGRSAFTTSRRNGPSSAKPQMKTGAMKAPPVGCR